VIALIHSLDESSLSAHIEQSDTPSTVFIVKHVGKPLINFKDSFIFAKSTEPCIELSSF